VPNEILSCVWLSGVTLCQQHPQPQPPDLTPFCTYGIYRCFTVSPSIRHAIFDVSSKTWRAQNKNMNFMNFIYFLTIRDFTSVKFVYEFWRQDSV